MHKIPTVFKRTEDMRSVIDEVTPGCEWVLAGEGVATRKWDGTCVMIADAGCVSIENVFVRREVKPGKGAPLNFVPTETDPVTGKTVGWEPAEQSSFIKFIEEALGMQVTFDPGTYELCGPKINGNPEKLAAHELIRHGSGSASFAQTPRDYDGLRFWLTDPRTEWFEGVVWHHPDGRMAKIKRRDFARS